MTVTYGRNDVKKDKKGNFYLTTDNQGLDNESIDINNFHNEKMKGVKITSNSTYTSGEWNWINTTLFNDVIIAKNSNHYIQLRGWGTKKVTTGDFKDTIEVVNSGTNKINLGNGENRIILNPIAGKNTITTGKDKDIYTIQGGDNKIVDMGGDNAFSFVYGSKNKITIKGAGTNTFTLSGGQNNITSTKGANIFTYNGNARDKIKTGSFVDKFDVLLMGSSSTININSGAGNDELTVKSYSYASSPSRVTADLGTGDDTIRIINGGSDFGVVTNIKTGKGKDNVEILAGLMNYIDTGKDTDTVTINGGNLSFISTGDAKDYVYALETNNGISTIKTGKGDDYISIAGGENTIYGGTGKDSIVIDGGYNTVYGGGDTIDLDNGENVIYACGDAISITNGKNKIYTKKGNNEINVGGGTTGTSNIINLSKGNNTVNLVEKTAQATVNITSGKNTINVNNIDQLLVKSTAKTYQTLKVNGCSGSDIVFDVKKGSCNILDGSSSNDIYGGSNGETFNIKGGSYNNLNGKGGNDIYNIYVGADSKITDTEGTNTFNVKKGYSGMSEILNTTATSKIVLDKSYKLTNSKNVQKDSSNNDIVVTSDNSVTIFGVYSTISGDFNDDSLSLIFNAQNEITDKNFDDNIIYNDTAGIYNIGGKNYKLDLTQLKSDLANWFDTHSDYKTTLSVFKSSTPIEDINSLMAVYTKDTAGCFVKA